MIELGLNHVLQKMDEQQILTKAQTKQMFAWKLTNFSGWQKFAVSQNAKECETLTSSVFTLVMNVINCQKENWNCSWFDIPSKEKHYYLT